MAGLGVNSGNVPARVIQEQGRELTPIYRSAVAVLSFGFRLGAALLAIGLLVAIVRQDSLKRTAEAYPDILPSVLDGDANGIISLAIVTLIATPVVTVLTVAIGFFRIGDRRFGVLSLFVLGVLGISISLSLFR